MGVRFSPRQPKPTRTVGRRPGSQLRKLVARSRVGIDTSTVRHYGRLTDRAIGAAWKARGTACGVGIMLSAFRQKQRAFTPVLLESERAFTPVLLELWSVNRTSVRRLFEAGWHPLRVWGSRPQRSSSLRPLRDLRPGNQPWREA